MEPARAATAVALLLLASTVAAAHPMPYLIGTSNTLIVCTTKDVGFDIGGVCIPAGHIVPDIHGVLSITVTDGIHPAASALFCQDLDADGFCAGASEARHFCGTLTLESGDYDVDEPMLVFVDGPILGGPLHSPCETLFSFGTQGTVTHS